MLKASALSATLWFAFEQIGAKGLPTTFMLVFARFLTAEDFGVFAAATVASGFVATLGVLGLRTVVVQRRDLYIRALSTAFWMALGASVTLALGIDIFASAIAGLFDNAAIAPLIPALAVGMVVGSASALLTALLRRELNMREFGCAEACHSRATHRVLTPRPVWWQLHRLVQSVKKRLLEGEDVASSDNAWFNANVGPVVTPAHEAAR